MGSKVSRRISRDFGTAVGQLNGLDPNQMTEVSHPSHSADSLPSSTSNSTQTHTTNPSSSFSTIIIDEELYDCLMRAQEAFNDKMEIPSHLPPTQRVAYAKIKNCVLFEDIHSDEYIMERYSLCLSDPQSMLETYLNLDNTITKQWDERMKMLEKENSILNHDLTSTTDSETSQEQKANPSEKKTAQSLHLFSPQFYELISIGTNQKKNVFEQDTSDMEDVKKTLSFEQASLSQFTLSTDSMDMVHIPKVFEELTIDEESSPQQMKTPHKLPQEQAEKSTTSKEVKWSEELVTSPPPSFTPQATPKRNPITSNTVMENGTPTFGTSVNAAVTTPQHYSTPSNNLTRSSAAADIPANVVNHHNLGTSITSGAISSGVEMVSNSHNSLGSISDEENLRDWWLSNPKLEKSIKIKLIVTDMHHHNKTKQTIRQIISPLLAPGHILPAFGMFHTSLVIGQFKIEWTDSSLCIPRKLSSQSSFLSADIEEITTAHDLEDIVKKLAQVICKWNSTMIYSERRRKKSKNKSKKSGKTSIKKYGNTGNCQDFIFDVLESIGKRDVLENLINSDGPMGQFMRGMLLQ